MNDALIHRGPDDGGVWVDAEPGLAIGNRRLAILDISAAGHQPMLSSCGRYALAYNGETYNFESVRKELNDLGAKFRGHSDTEVIVEGCAAWGVRSTIERLNGMFALAVWDRQERQLTVARDRLGIKPLYYGWSGARSTLLFGSELKALAADPEFTPVVARESLLLYARTGYIPAPHSIYKNVYKLPPGHLLEVTNGRDSRVQQYWSPKELSDRGHLRRFEGNEREATDHLDTLLRDAVRLQTIADVPVGAFLSGGVDSTTVVAMMQAEQSRRVKTFSIGFHEASHNEAKDAKEIAARLGTDHTELYVDHDQALAVIPHLAEMYDEPFADSSQIPTFLVSRLTRSKVTVSLSGDGGDELFAGYSHYFRFSKYWNAVRMVPPVIRGVARSLYPDEGVRGSSPGRAAARLARLGSILQCSEPETLYVNLISRWKRPTELVAGAISEPRTAFTSDEAWMRDRSALERVMHLDVITYLPDDILTKVDRASMAVGLEARVPLLDHRIVEFSYTLPLALKVRDGRGKYLLRQVLSRYVPLRLVDRPKQGFSLPMGSWLRGPLRGWAEDLLSEKRLAETGVFHAAPVRAAWQDHLRGRADRSKALWTILMYQAWEQQWVGGARPQPARTPSADHPSRHATARDCTQTVSSNRH